MRNGAIWVCSISIAITTLAPPRTDESAGRGKGLLWERRKARFPLTDCTPVGLPPTLLAARAAPARDRKYNVTILGFPLPRFRP